MGRPFKRKYRDKKTGEMRVCSTYTIEYTVNGHKYREPTKTTRKENAEQLLREKEQAIWEGRFTPGKKRKKHQDLTLGALRDLWEKEKATKKSIGHDRARFRTIIKHLGEHRLVSTISAQDVSDARSKLGKTPATRNRHLALLHSALILAAARGHGHQDPMASIKLEGEGNERNRVCSPDEYRRLLDAAAGEMRFLIVIGYWCGMRLGEIVNLRRDQVDAVARTIRLASSETKEGGSKTIPLPADAVPLIDKLPPTTNGRLCRFTVSTYSRHFTEIVDELEIPDFSFHDFRHTAVTNLMNAGADLITIQSITGHKTLHMTKRYTHVSDARRLQVLRAVEAHAAGREDSKR